MRRIKQHKQLELFDSWRHLGEKRRKLLDQSWPGLFRKHILEELPVGEFMRFFNARNGRPTKELHTVLGALLLQQAHDFTDVETVNQLAFNIQWHYALNIPEESDELKYICEKTLWSMRRIATKHEIDRLMMERTSEKLAKVFGVDAKNQRIDSVHIRSNMKKLGRIGLFVKIINNFLRNLKRRHKDLFNTVPEKIADRYLSRKFLSVFSMVKPSESAKTLKSVGADLFELVEMFKDHEAAGMNTYKAMRRALNEQCDVESGVVTVKKPKEIASDSLQNPSDPDATYSAHKGQGYKAQIMETFTMTDDPDEKDRTLNLITHVELDKACGHDSHALIPAIEDAVEKGLGPETVLADTHYGTDENVTDAREKGVELIAPTTKGGKAGKSIGLEDFEFDEKGRVTKCPHGEKPERVRLRKRFSVYFDVDNCKNCPHMEDCPIKPGGKHYYLRYTHKDYRLAERRAREKTAEFLNAYRWRSGVEATMSQLNALTGAKNLRVRGFTSVRFCVVLKAVGVNIARAAAVMKNLIRRKGRVSGFSSTDVMLFPFFKERILTTISKIVKNQLSDLSAAENYMQSAA